MALPFFYTRQYDTATDQLTLDEDNSRHIVQVLRMKTGEHLHLTDGKGHLLTAEIISEHKKHCTVRIREKQVVERKGRLSTIAISLLKNANRFEWFLEKATEMGIQRIIPLLCERTEKEKFRSDRMEQICISAMLQSQQCWLPDLYPPSAFRPEQWMAQTGIHLIAHCAAGEKQAAGKLLSANNGPAVICIGPEGDFTATEIADAIQSGYQPVSLGETRLRTETAGIVAAALLAQL